MAASCLGVGDTILQLTFHFDGISIIIVEGIVAVVIEWNWFEIEFLLRIIISEIMEHFRNRSVLVCSKRQSHSTRCRENDVID